MSKRSLPTETLEHIFSSDVEQRELAFLCRASKRFYNIAKPFLYRSITLQSVRQADKFKKSSREEDVKLVRSVKVVGKDNPWIVHDFTEVLTDFMKVSPTQVMAMEAGCVKRLLEGSLLKTSNLTSLYIHDVLEDPRTVQNATAAPKLPSGALRNLVELSIVSYRGGGNVVDSQPGARLSGIQRRHFRSIHKYLHLAVLIFSIDRASSLDRRKLLYKSHKYAILFLPAFPKYFRDFDIIFEHFAEIATNYSSYSLKYLALPSRIERLLWARERMILDRLTDLGVSVHFDGDLGSVIAPPSFFEFRKKEEEEEEEARRTQEEAGRE
ncbi:hypothetical protein JCM5350_001935 [Sporobolomyces pararoseus]